MVFVIIALVVLAVVVVLLALVVVQLMLQGGRVLLQIGELEAALQDAILQVEPDSPAAQGLPVGIGAPPFELPDLYGTRRSLGEWRGQRLLLIFFDPGCRFCLQLLPSLTALAGDPHEGRPTPLIVSTGDAAENRRIFEEAQFPWAVLLQDEAEVANAYYVDGTPMAYLIESDSTIESPLVSGVQAVLIQAGATSPITLATDGADHTPFGGSRAFAASRIKRDGLESGVEAPLFRLPNLAGGELSLLDYRGKRVLIVFSDPDCAPCNLLAPDLEAAHQRSADPAVVMISRGPVEANREKVAAYGLTFPVALQRHWEVSREYAMFATPIGYLVDKWGIIAADVAVGPEAILALAATPAED